MFFFCNFVVCFVFAFNRTGKIYIPGKDQWGRPIMVFDNSVQVRGFHLLINRRITYLLLLFSFLYPFPFVRLSQNTTDVENQMRFLAWNLEFLIREMDVDANTDKFVDKYLIFMHLENFSFLNMPPFKATRETITMLTTCYPERLGHCILYKVRACVCHRGFCESENFRCIYLLCW